MYFLQLKFFDHFVCGLSHRLDGKGYPTYGPMPKRDIGIEPMTIAWKATVLPLN